MSSPKMHGAVPVVCSIQENEVTIQDPANGEDRKLCRHQRVGSWTLMAVLRPTDRRPMAVFENTQDRDGVIVYIDQCGVVLELGKTLAPMRVSEHNCYRGHSKEEVLAAECDILAQEILAQASDPSYETVAACLPPIRHVQSWWGEAPHTFVGSRENLDVVPVMWDGTTARVDPLIVAPEIKQVLEEEQIWEGLVGGWLPAIRLLYPVQEELCWEMVAFAEVQPPTMWIQPVWYRFLRLEHGEITKAHYFHSYHPYPWPNEPAPETFYTQLLELHTKWGQLLQGSMEIDLPEAWVADLCRHALVREMITRVGEHPRYGVADRYYGGPEHDGFQDTFNTSVNAFLEWGLFEIAKGYIENYLSEFVREDGSIDYRGPETAQYGRMLACLAQYYSYTADADLLLKHDAKLQGLVNVLMARRQEAKRLPKDHAAFGMIVGRDEADCYGYRPDPSLYELPYFSNSTEAWRGFRALGETWITMGNACGRPDLVARGTLLTREAQLLHADILKASARAMSDGAASSSFPLVAGWRNPHDQQAGLPDPSLVCAARTRSEMLHSGVLTKETVERILSDSCLHSGARLGVFGSQERIQAFTACGQGYGLIQHDLIREFLLFYYSLVAHCHTRGTWTALEVVDVDRERAHHAPYCSPAQLTIPAVTKWMLVFEDPLSPALWLAKATPRSWLEHGQHICIRNAPTRWGKVSYEIISHLEEGKIEARIEAPQGGLAASLNLRLRLPGTCTIQSVTVNGKPWEQFDIVEEVISLPSGTAGSMTVTVHCSKAN